MALLQPIVGIGQIYGNTILRGNNEFVQDIDINTPTGIEVQFYSPTGEYVGMVGTTFDNSNLINLSISENKIGALEKFEFSINRIVDIPFYNLMETRFYINGVKWFTGELQLKPNTDRRNPKFAYEGRGYISYLKEIMITKLYESKTLEYILKDLIENDISADTPIQYSPDRITPPDYTVTKLEFKNKTVTKAIEEILKIANESYKTNQYRYGVDKDKIFFFEQISNAVITGLYEGFQYQQPDVKEDLSKVVNKIDLYRAIENSQDVEFVSTKSNSESIGLYGERRQDIVLSDFVDTTTAERIADAILDKFKDPIQEITVDQLITNKTPYDIGFYKINNKQDDYIEIINEFENTSDWTLNISNTTVTSSNTKSLTGKKSFEVTYASGSAGEYIDYELDEVFYFPDKLSVYIASEERGDFFNIQIFDEDGNSDFLSKGFILSEDDSFLLLEDGNKVYLESGNAPIEIFLIEDFQKIKFDISSFENVKKIRIIFASDEVNTIYFDRLEIEANIYKSNLLTIDEIEYSQQGNTLLANVVFGDQIDSIINDIKKLDEKQINTINIFQKS